MKDIIIVALTKIPTITAICAAAWLSYKGKEGWGWFLFVSVLVTSSVKVTD